MKFDKNSILKIARSIFKNKNINLNSNINNVSNWDSINHVKFICEIQKKFKVNVSFEQTIAISSISDLIKLLKKIK